MKKLLGVLLILAIATALAGAVMLMAYFLASQAEGVLRMMLN